MAESERLEHGFGPFIPENMQVLILGTFPSVKSREVSFFYGNRQNVFWKLLADYFHEEEPRSEQDKKTFLNRHGIGLYDVIEQCDIIGSADSSIRNVVPADIASLVGDKPVGILLNGQTASRIFRKYNRLEAFSVPSSSPANAAMTYAEKLSDWSKALDRFFRR